MPGMPRADIPSVHEGGEEVSRKINKQNPKSVADNATELTDHELNHIQWRATRGSHYETAFLINSEYARQVIEDDVPRLIAEIRRLRIVVDAQVAAEVERARQEGRLWG